jgi:hypothetical protein
VTGSAGKITIAPPELLDVVELDFHATEGAEWDPDA